MARKLDSKKRKEAKKLVKLLEKSYKDINVLFTNDNKTWEVKDRVKEKNFSIGGRGYFVGEYQIPLDCLILPKKLPKEIYDIKTGFPIRVDVTGHYLYQKEFLKN